MARQYTIMLMTLALFFLLCMSTSIVFIFLSILHSEIGVFYGTLGEISVILNKSMNFVFYWISGEAFRNAFKLAVCGKRGRRESNSSYWTNIFLKNYDNQNNVNSWDPLPRHFNFIDWMRSQAKTTSDQTHFEITTRFSHIEIIESAEPKNERKPSGRQLWSDMRLILRGYIYREVFLTLNDLIIAAQNWSEPILSVL